MTEPAPLIDPGDRCPACGAAVDGSWLVCAWCGGALAAPAELSPGSVLDDRYEVRRVIGRGGFGITYEVLDQRLQRSVAVKELFPPSAVRHSSLVLVAPRDRDAFGEARDRFLREARVLARFTQPGIVHVYEVFEAHNTAYLVMELLSGRTLSDLLRARGSVFSPDEALDVAARVATALTSVHEAGLLHRDVNPSNIMLTDQGRIVLIDFGLARRFDGEVSESMTRAVTPGYAPPEQYAGTGDFGPACDVYGLAATLYRLLTGQTPVGAFDRQAGTRLTPPIELQPSVPKLVSDAVLDGLELNPNHRPATAAGFVDRLGLHDVELPAQTLVAVPGSAVSSPGPAPAGVPLPGGSALAPAAVPAGPPPVPPAPVAVAPVAAALAVGSPVPAGARVGAVAAPMASPAPDRRVVAGAAPAPPAYAPLPARAEPPVVGPLPPGRALVTVPAGLALAALSSSTPVVITGLMLLVVLPGLATLGDMVVQRYRADIGADVRAWHRVDARAAAPLFYLRNLLTGVLRSIPGLALGALAVAVAAAVGDPHVESGWRDLVIRVGGLGTMLCLLLPARTGGRGFRSGAGINRIVGELVDARGHLRPSGWVAVIVSIASVALGLWLHPELWPLGV